MSLAGDPLDHLLPLLKLPPRQMKKTHISCKKWLARFFRIVAPEAGIQAHDGDAFGALAARLLPPHEQATGFHSSTLPFVVCSVPLQLPRDAVEGAGAGARALSHSVSVMHVAVAELAHFAASAEGASSCPSGADLRDDEVTQTGALEASSSTSSSSAKKGCGFLYLVPCDAAAVRSRVAHLLQRPVVGIERLLPSSTSLSCAAAEEERGSQDCSSRARPTQSLSNGAAPPARTCTSQAVPDVPGLFLVEDFVTADEEKTIWHELHHGRPRLQMEYLSRRRVAHFNRRFLYGVNALTAEGDVTNARPSFYVWMRARLQNDMAAGGVRIDGDYPFRPGDHECDQLTVNYYDYSEVGACGIAAHVDAHNAFDDAVFIVSLGSYTVMEFSRWDAPAEVAAPVGVYLAPRSLVVIAGEARYGWTHCISEKRTDTLSELLPTFSRGDRMSLTWRRGRTQRHTKAECPYPALCDGA
ncbi:2OG-Fe(II) oxygenase family protein [Leishmania donovani]|uniref:2OG-Fe(II) oxygenase family protein n=1 Tax=Leishmania donovani TaxID=5661 RepID=A0A504X4T0_LEIDO|nr:2OG-Fe(II) oxygenase family protein [Leishmania donovani]